MCGIGGLVANQTRLAFCHVNMEAVTMLMSGESVSERLERASDGVALRQNSTAFASQPAMQHSHVVAKARYNNQVLETNGGL
jgi:hypothetical protein